jgi:hypothetical protein
MPMLGAVACCGAGATLAIHCKCPSGKYGDGNGCTLCPGFQGAMGTTPAAEGEHQLHSISAKAGQAVVPRLLCNVRPCRHHCPPWEAGLAGATLVSCMLHLAPVLAARHGCMCMRPSACACHCHSRHRGGIAQLRAPCLCAADSTNPMLAWPLQVPPRSISVPAHMEQC